MKSIRGTLARWLLSGLLLLWVAASAGVYVAVRQSLIRSIDAQLAIDARIVRFAARGEADEGSRGRGGRLDDRMTDYQQPDGSAFYQIWNNEGEAQEKSESLGQRDLPEPSFARDDVFGISSLGDGTRLRTLTFRVGKTSGGGGKGPGKGKGRGVPSSQWVMLGRAMAGLEDSLNSLLGGLFLVGFVVAAGGVGLVGLAVRKGLRPLELLAEQTREVDASTLGARFVGERAPSELAPVYASLNGLLERLEGSFERERRFSADLAHEMRTPVAELRMLCEVALKWPNEAGPQTHEQALEIAGRLEMVTESLLTLAKLESGESRLKIEAVSMPGLLRECWEGHSGKAAELGLNIDWECDDSVVWETDAGVLRLVVNNLLSNMAEYTPANGRATIIVAEDRIVVMNEAPGMNEDLVERMFERFWRADAARADGGHCGLGLALARQGAAALDLGLTASWKDGLLSVWLKKS